MAKTRQRIMQCKKQGAKSKIAKNCAHAIELQINIQRLPINAPVAQRLGI